MAVGQFISKLLTSKNNGYNDGLNAFGDFDPESYVNANLEKAKGTPGTNLPTVTQGITQLLGLGPKKMIGAPTPSVADRAKSSPLTDDWINGILK